MQVDGRLHPKDQFDANLVQFMYPIMDQIPKSYTENLLRGLLGHPQVKDCQWYMLGKAVRAGISLEPWLRESFSKSHPAFLQIGADPLWAELAKSILRSAKRFFDRRNPGADIVEFIQDNSRKSDEKYTGLRYPEKYSTWQKTVH